MAGTGKSQQPMEMLVVAGFSALVAISCLVGLFTEAVLSAPWFASLAGVAVFGPLLVFSCTMLRPTETGAKGKRGRRGRGKQPGGRMDSYMGVYLAGGFALALAAGAVSGVVALTVDGVTEFEVGLGRGYRYMLPVPLFIAVLGAGALAVGSLALFAFIAIRRRRSSRGNEAHAARND